MVRIAFVMPNKQYLSYGYLSAMLKREIPDVEVKVFYDPQAFAPHYRHVRILERLLDVREKLLEELREWNPDVIGFTVLTDTYPWALSMAQEIKTRKIGGVIFFGGMHVTLSAKPVLMNDCVDFGCVAEGEHMMVDFVKSLQRGQIDYSVDSLVYRKNGKPHENPVRPQGDNLDELPWLDTDLMYEAAPAFRLMRTYHTLTSRGCPYTCTFCSHSVTNSVFQGTVKTLRRRSVDDVIAELKMAKAKYRMKRVMFWDELFTLQPKWVEAFAERYREEINVPFLAAGHPMQLSDKMIEVLESANCGHITLGAQHPFDETVRRKLFNRIHSNERLNHILDRLHQTKMYVNTDNIIQLPNQTIEDALKYVDFYLEHPVDEASTFFLRYYAGAEITENAYRQGYLTDEQYESIANGLETPDITEIRGPLNEGTHKGKDNGSKGAALSLGPHTAMGASDSRQMDKVRTLITMTPVMPRWFSRMLRQTGLWRLIPAISLMDVFRLFGGYLRWLTHGKTPVRVDLMPVAYLWQAGWILRGKVKFWMRQRGSHRRPTNASAQEQATTQDRNSISPPELQETGSSSKSVSTMTPPKD